MFPEIPKGYELVHDRGEKLASGWKTCSDGDASYRPIKNTEGSSASQWPNYSFIKPIACKFKVGDKVVARYECQTLRGEVVALRANEQGAHTVEVKDGKVGGINVKSARIDFLEEFLTHDKPQIVIGDRKVSFSDIGIYVGNEFVPTDTVRAIHGWFKREQPKLTIAGRNVEFKDNGIQIGCQFVCLATINEIVAELGQK